MIKFCLADRNKTMQTLGSESSRVYCDRRDKDKISRFEESSVTQQYQMFKLLIFKIILY